MAEDTSSVWFERWRHALTLVIVLAIIGGAAAFVLRRPAPTVITIIPPGPTATPLPTSTPEPIQVYVTGEVINPQTTLTLPHGSRVADAIAGAGGFTSNADPDRINPAAVLRDGDQIHVYGVVEVAAGGEDAAADDLALATPSDSGIVYVNVATLEELDTLPRIGPAIGQRIIDYREANGYFTSLADLDNVSGIGPATLEQIAPYISFDIP